LLTTVVVSSEISLKSKKLNFSYNYKKYLKGVVICKPFKNDGLEIVSKEDIEDLKLLKATREEETISFEDYLKNEN